ncbi:MAG: protein TolQ [SAR116 cluster bacterium]|nr:protein TolQ [SAR116 cluster bacterium]
MEQEVVKEVLEGSANLSLWSLFLQADIVVKFVMLILLLASVWCWTIIIEKIFLSRRELRLADSFENEFWSGTSLDDIYDEMTNEINRKSHGAISSVFSSAMQEWRRATNSGLVSKGDNFKASLSQRIDRGMGVAITKEIGRLERGMTFLASIGSVAPFIGLFGTVWGIMNSFSAIAASKNTSLAVVAPGIAEALFATALGLLAAIPAVAAYNKFSNDIEKVSLRLENFSVEFMAILSRRLDEDS